MIGFWSLINATGDLPLGRSSNIAQVIEDKLYVFSGENIPRVPIDNDLYVLDLNNSTWKKIDATEQSPVARVGHAATTLHGKLYMFGQSLNSNTMISAQISNTQLSNKMIQCS